MPKRENTIIFVFI